MVRKKRKKARRSYHAAMAAELLPPTPTNCPPYSELYFESYKPRFFEACRNSRHRHCPKTAEQGSLHLYCSCPCHRRDLKRHQKRKLWTEMKKVIVRKPKHPRSPSAPRAASPGGRGQSKRFRYVKKPSAVPAGIFAIVHEAVSTLKEGTVAEIAKLAVENGLTKFTGQDPVNQTSVMLHRMLKDGAVEILP